MKTVGVICSFLFMLLLLVAYTVAENVTSGTGAGANLGTGNLNVLIGEGAGQQLKNGIGNTFIGRWSGNRGGGVDYSIKLGYMAGMQDTTDNRLYISNRPLSATSSSFKGIWGDLTNGYFGFNKVATVALDVNGAAAISGAVTATSIATPTGGGVLSIPDSLNVTGVLTVPTIKTAVGGTQLSLADSVDISGALVVTGTSTSNAAVIVTPSLTVKNNVAGAGTDSLFSVTFTTGSPVLTLNASDGDASTISINTSDQEVHAGASGGYVFDARIAQQGAVGVDDTLHVWRSSLGTTVASVDSFGVITGLQKVIVSDAAMAPTAIQSGAMFVARPLTAKRTATLPEAAAGLNYTFFVDDADSLLITTASGDSLITSAGVAWKTTSSIAGTIKVVGMDAVRWIMVFTLGTWTSY